MLKIAAASTLIASFLACSAHSSPEPETRLSVTISRAQVVAVADITGMSFLRSKLEPGSVIPNTVLYGPAIYSFAIRNTLKGSIGPTAEIQLPTVDAQYYNYAKFSLGKGSRVLLFLSRMPSGQLVPVDQVVPLVPTSHAETKLPNTDPVSAVVKCLSDSLIDPKLRRCNSFLLRDLVHPVLASKLIRYQDDPDTWTRDAVLYGLAVNQQLSAIKRIANLEAQLEARGEGARSVEALEKYTDPRAIPLLAPLLVDRSEFIRLNVSFCLEKLADTSSLPFLILALQDPHSLISYKAYRTIHRLAPELGEPKDWDAYEMKRDTEIAIIHRWWRDELRGDHKRSSLEHH